MRRERPRLLAGPFEQVDVQVGGRERRVDEAIRLRRFRASGLTDGTLRAERRRDEA